MNLANRWLLIFSVWLGLNLIFVICTSLLRIDDQCHHDDYMPAWYLLGTIVYFLIAFMIAILIPRNIAKEYIKMTKSMALDNSCLSSMEHCEQVAYKEFRGNPKQTNIAMSACIGESSKSACTDKLIAKCGELMSSKSNRYFEDFQGFAETRSTKETLGMCKGVAESSINMH